jgi:hypothetical protein
MGAKLTKRVVRETPTTVFDRSKLRYLIVSVEPAGQQGTSIGLRIKGTRQTYRIGLRAVFQQAIRLHEQRIERRFNELKKAGIPPRSAKVQARKELNKELGAS